jgi:hypothetical protein
MKQVIQQLKAAQLKARKELIAVTAALTALGASHKFLGSDRPKRHLTPAGRRAIQKAQRARWAKLRKKAR